MYVIKYKANKGIAVVVFCLHFIIRESGWADAIISIFLHMH